MPIEHLHPRARNGAGGKDLSDDIINWCSHLPPDLTTATMDENFTKIVQRLRAHGTKKTPAQRGRMFEWVVYDVVARIAASKGLNPLDYIEVNVDMQRGKHAEADLLVNDKLAILIKTSYRERWKQVDRDAMIMKFFGNRKGLTVWTLFYAEHDEDDMSVARNKSATVQSQCYADVEVGSVKDHERMEEFMRDVFNCLPDATAP